MSPASLTAVASLKDRLFDCLPAGRYALAGLLRLVDVVETDAVPTAAVECHAQPRLLINPAFVAQHAATPEKLMMLVLHAIHHRGLGLHNKVLSGDGCKGRPMRCVGWQQAHALRMAEHALRKIGCAHDMQHGLRAGADLRHQTLHRQASRLQGSQHIAQPLFVTNSHQGCAALFGHILGLGLEHQVQLPGLFQQTVF